MIVTKIVICPKDQEKPAFPEINGSNYFGKGELYGVSILEKGMQSGKTSLGLVIKLSSSDDFVLVETSEAMFEAIFAALQGAKERFKQ